MAADGSSPGCRIACSHDLTGALLVAFQATDPALDALFVPFDNGELAWPADGRVLFLRARDGFILRERRQAGWVFEQSFKPFADALARSGFHALERAPDDRFSLVLVLPPRQRDEARALMARAIAHAVPGGIVVAAMPNAEGAKSGEADLATLAGAVRNLSKHKCRVFWTAPLQGRSETVEAWMALDDVQPIGDGRFVSRPGLFAWDRVDTASALLAAHLPSSLEGRVADLGAGYGYLAREIIARCPGVTAIDLYEAEARALEPARINLENADRKIPFEVFWHDVTLGLPHRYDTIVSNPPFHQGRADLPELGRAFIARAADALLPHGEFWMVANRHLPYESILAARFDDVRAVTVQDGFKVIAAKGVKA
jgi:16S rRNA (guanine1207-N2)-methyltransferase